MNLHLFLVLLSGICWTIVYIDSIRVGFKFKTYAMPFWALALNIGWEVLHTIFGYIDLGINPQTVINLVWAVFDAVILYTYFKFGIKFFPKELSKKWFYIGSVSGLISAFIIQYLFIYEFGLIHGATYAAFLQNLMMSVLYIGMLVKRGSSEGQTLTIAINKCIGTIAPSILFGIVGLKSLGGPKHMYLVIGIMIAIVDIVYIIMLMETIKREKSKC